MTLDARARETARKLLAKFGKAGLIKRVTEGAYDPATGTSALTETSYSILFYIDQPNQKELSSSLVTVNSEMAIFAAKGLAIEPALTDKITVDGADRAIVMVNAVWSGEQVALWRVGLAS